MGDDEVAQLQEQMQIQTKPSKQLKKETNPLKFFYPKFLSKLSDTYFKSVNSAAKKKKKFHQRSISSTPTMAKQMNNNLISKVSNEIFKKKLVADSINQEFLNLKNYNSDLKEEQGKNEQQSESPASGRLNLNLNKTMPIIEYGKHARTLSIAKNSLNNSYIQNPSNDEKCIICQDNEPDAVFMPCGHGGACLQCSEEILLKNNECYLCRNNISHLLQMDLSKKQGNLIAVISASRLVETPYNNKQQNQYSEYQNQ